MRIIDIRDSINRKSDFRLDEHKLSSILHRVKDKESPNEELIKSLSKIYTLNDDVIEYCKDIDFSNINKSGTGSKRSMRW